MRMAGMVPGRDVEDFGLDIRPPGSLAIVGGRGSVEELNLDIRRLVWDGTNPDGGNSAIFYLTGDNAFYFHPAAIFSNLFG